MLLSSNANQEEQAQGMTCLSTCRMHNSLVHFERCGYPAQVLCCQCSDLLASVTNQAIHRTPPCAKPFVRVLKTCQQDRCVAWLDLRAEWCTAAFLHARNQHCAGRSISVCRVAPVAAVFHFMHPDKPSRVSPTQERQIHFRLHHRTRLPP